MAIGLACALTTLAAAADKFPEPTGIGKATFGMAVAEVKELFPNMRPTKATEAALKKGGEQTLAEFDLDDQSVGPLKCKCRLRFFKERFYQASFNCPDRDPVVEYLNKTYGPPTQSTATSIYWMGEHGMVGLAPRSAGFSLEDVKIGKEVQMTLVTAVFGQTPVITPVAPTP